MTTSAHTSRNVTAGEGSPERYEIYTMCECAACGGTGKERVDDGFGLLPSGERCPECRGEGRTKILLATTGTPEGIGTIIVTLGREGEFADCPIGILDTEGEKNQKWLVRPWQSSTREVSAAARLLAKSKTKTILPCEHGLHWGACPECERIYKTKEKA